MERTERLLGLHPRWWALILLATMAAFVGLVAAMFNKSFTSTVPITLISDRAGLVMETGAKV